MWRSFLAEWPKIRRRGVLMALVAMVIITGLAVYLGIAKVHSRNGAAIAIFALGQSNGLVGLLLRGGNLIAVIAQITLGAVIGAEWTQGTLRNLLIQEPGRLRVLWGKVAAPTVYMLIAATISTGLGIAVAVMTAPTVGISTTAWWGDVGISNLLSFAGNLAMAVIAWCLFGTMVAVLVRNAAGAVGAAIGWSFVVEGLTLLVWPDVGQWLPGRLIITVLNGGTAAIPYSTGLIWSAVYCIAMVIIASASFQMRDVLA